MYNKDYYTECKFITVKELYQRLSQDGLEDYQINIGGGCNFFIHADDKNKFVNLDLCPSLGNPEYDGVCPMKFYGNTHTDVEMEAEYFDETIIDTNAIINRAVNTIVDTIQSEGNIIKKGEDHGKSE